MRWNPSEEETAATKEDTLRAADTIAKLHQHPLGRAAAISWLRWVVSTLVMALVFPLMLGRMGTASFGLWAALTAPTSMSSLFSLGVSPAVVSIVGRSLGRARVATEDSAAAEHLGTAGSCAKTGLLVSMLTGLVAVAAGWIAAGWIVNLLNIGAADAASAQLLFRASSACLGGMLVGAGVTAILEATGRIDLSSIALGLISVLNAGLLMAAALIGPSYANLALVSLATAVLNVVVPLVFLAASKRAALLRWGRIDRTAVRALAALALSLGLVGALGAMIDPAVKWTIAAVGGGVPVAAYEVASRVMLLVAGSFAALIAPLLPHYASALTQTGRSYVAVGVVSASRLLSALALPGIAIFAAAASGVMQLWLGDEVPSGAVASVQILAVSSAISLTLRPAWGALVAAGLGRRILLAQIASVVCVAALLALAVAGILPLSTAPAITVAAGAITGAAATLLLFAQAFGRKPAWGLSRAPLLGLALGLAAAVVVAAATLAGLGAPGQVIVAAFAYLAVLVYLWRVEPSLRSIVRRAWSRPARPGPPEDDAQTPRDTQRV